MQFEITVKEYSKIKEIGMILKKYNIKKICITQKFKYMNNIEVSRQLLEIIPELEITLNFSICENYHDDYSLIENDFLKFMDEANILGIKRFLIISGVPRKLYTTLDLLKFLKFRDLKDNQIFCAYNPFLTNYLGDDEEEKLRYKEASKIISGIYYQLGDDIYKLRSGIKLSKHIMKGKKFYGSILVPNTFILNNLKYKPWYGVKYSDEFLNNITYSNKKTIELLKIYKENDIEPLVDIIPFSPQNLYLTKKLFKA